MNIPVLISAQLTEWPESIILGPEEVMEWVKRAQTTPGIMARMESVTRAALNYETRLFYYTSGRDNASFGMRYGAEPQEYISFYEAI